MSVEFMISDSMFAYGCQTVVQVFDYSWAAFSWSRRRFNFLFLENLHAFKTSLTVREKFDVLLPLYQGQIKKMKKQFLFCFFILLFCDFLLFLWASIFYCFFGILLSLPFTTTRPRQNRDPAHPHRNATSSRPRTRPRTLVRRIPSRMRLSGSAAA
jgi:hypothetical protein